MTFYNTHFQYVCPGLNLDEKLDGASFSDHNDTPLRNRCALKILKPQGVLEYMALDTIKYFIDKYQNHKEIPTNEYLLDLEYFPQMRTCYANQGATLDKLFRFLIIE